MGLLTSILVYWYFVQSPLKCFFLSLDTEPSIFWISVKQLHNHWLYVYKFRVPKYQVEWLGMLTIMSIFNGPINHTAFTAAFLTENGRQPGWCRYHGWVYGNLFQGKVSTCHSFDTIWCTISFETVLRSLLYKIDHGKPHYLSTFLCIIFLLGICSTEIFTWQQSPPNQDCTNDHSRSIRINQHSWVHMSSSQRNPSNNGQHLRKFLSFCLCSLM